MDATGRGSAAGSDGAFARVCRRVEGSVSVKTNLLEVVGEVRRHLEQNGRVSLRMLRRQFELDDESLAALIEELVDVQRVARREDTALAWSPAAPAAAPALTVASPERDPRAYTPKHLADKILHSKSALEGERKQVTVLFADVKGSMELAEQLDPEEWHRIMDRFFTILAGGIHRFEGTVVQFTGDGIMALFGAPLAHEDHAQRACWAALHLQEGLRNYADELRRTRGLNFSVRMGLNSGEVVVGKIGDDLRMDYTAQGHTVGLAQRTEQLAEAGRTYLTEQTAALVGGYFRLRDLGAFTLKGVRHPVHIHELEGAGASRTRLDVSRARGFFRFVGRADEMAAVEAAMARACDGHGQVVGIMGEPGVGKSRLCHELTEKARARDMRVHTAHCVAHGKMVPFLPVLELMRDFFGLTEQDGDEAAQRKIAGTLLLLDQALTDALPLVFDFLGVADPAEPPLRMDPEARQRQLFALVKRVAQARSRREPALLLFEDLHWIDDGSAPFVETLVDAVPGTRTLLVVNFRPEYHAAWMQKSHYLQLPLLPLGPEASSELLRELLGSDPSVAGLGERIRKRTAGNPFFAEEIIQALAEAGSLDGSKGAYRLRAPVETLALPASVQVVLGARIDRLPEREKQVLQTAAVIGKEFGEAVLQRVAGLPEAELAAALRALVQAELVYETALYPEAEYTFKHPLTQEVAYGSQLGERRKRVHAAVARAIEATSAEKLDEQAALLAHHWERAGEALTAASWHARAADWAGARDRETMIRHWARVRALLADVPESAETLALGVVARTRMIHNAIFLGDAGVDAAVLFAEGMELAERLEGPAPRVILLSEYGGVPAQAGQMHEGLAHLSEGVALADRSADPFLRFMARTPYCAYLGIAGCLREAVRIATEAEALCGGSPDLGAEITGFSPYCIDLVSRGLAMAWLGHPVDGAEVIERAIEVARQRRDAEAGAYAHSAASGVCELLGDAGSALSEARQGVEMAEAIGGPTFRAIALANLARAHELAGQWTEASEVAEAALALVHTRRAGLLVETEYLAVLAHALLRSGAPARALEAAEEAVARTRERGLRTYEIRALLARADVLIATAGAPARSRVEADLRDAAAVIDATEARVFTPQVHVERAALARVLGDEATHRRELREAHRLFTEMGATARAEQAAREFGA
jgi:class 3 adenylate cyclase/tetratricopeptide (TPR) repeat protein